MQKIRTHFLLPDIFSKINIGEQEGTSVLTDILRN